MPYQLDEIDIVKNFQLKFTAPNSFEYRCVNIYTIHFHFMNC
jgi:hypothetical protein